MFRLPTGPTFAPECADEFAPYMMTSLHRSVSMDFRLLRGLHLRVNAFSASERADFTRKCADESVPERAD